MFWRNIKRKNFVVFMAVLVLVMVLSSCSFDGEKTGLVEDVPPSGGREITAPTAGSQIKEDAEESEGKTDSVDDKQNGSEESENIPAEEVEVQGDSGTSDNMPELTEKDQGQQEEGQQETGQKQPEGGQSNEQVQTWKSAYLEVIYHLWDYLAPRYDPLSHKDTREEYGNPAEIDIFFLGLHDFDGDGILELITGDDLGLAVFTYEDSCVKKIADLCNPDLLEIWCVNGVYFKENSISVVCAGSGGSDYVNFGCFKGKYVLGHYNERKLGKSIIINGMEGTVEEMDQIYTLDYGKREEMEKRERFRLVNENGIWILKHYGSDEESVLDINFDFDSVLWE